ncbi:hypothetical protein KIN20_006596 [Parelaphostrongylus tenuis]|uniref:Uncharacterized protein n=1 Tax=Parelaphostrongylus tenuis TaxID=148309 RepID=A0AAD5MUB0_PARTN|nr:hypothetical protein KIN20_006596 [Parelaphostrongylus tenuis]
MSRYTPQAVADHDLRRSSAATAEAGLSRVGCPGSTTRIACATLTGCAEAKTRQLNEKATKAASMSTVVDRIMIPRITRERHLWVSRRSVVCT